MVINGLLRVLQLIVLQWLMVACCKSVHATPQKQNFCNRFFFKVNRVHGFEYKTLSAYSPSIASFGWPSPINYVPTTNYWLAHGVGKEAVPANATSELKKHIKIIAPLLNLQLDEQKVQAIEIYARSFFERMNKSKFISIPHVSLKERNHSTSIHNAMQDTLLRQDKTRTFHNKKGIWSNMVAMDEAFLKLPHQNHRDGTTE